MRAEIDALLGYLRGFLGSAGENGAEPVDRDLLLDLAQRHCVLPVLPDAPTALLRQQTYHNFALTAELFRLVPLFAARGIAVIPLKGPVLAVAIYGNMGLRMFADLDLMIRWEDISQAAELLQTAGYRLHSPLSWKGNFHDREDQLSFEHDTSWLRLDLHWSLTPSYFPQPVAKERLWSGLTTVEVAGRAVPALIDEDLILFLCCHGNKHLWDRLGWICDVARLIQMRPELDWRLIWENAERQKCRRILLVGLALAQQLLGAKIPADLAQKTAADAVVQSRMKWVRARLYAGTKTVPGAIESVRYMLPLLASVRDKVRYALGVTMAPTSAEYQVLKLPPGLFWLYYPFRVLRLGWKYSFGR